MRAADEAAAVQQDVQRAATQDAPRDAVRKSQRPARAENDKRKKPGKKKFSQRTPFAPVDDGDPRYSRRSRSDRRVAASSNKREEAPFAKFKKKKKGRK